MAFLTMGDGKYAIQGLQGLSVHCPRLAAEIPRCRRIRSKAVLSEQGEGSAGKSPERSVNRVLSWMGHLVVKQSINF